MSAGAGARADAPELAVAALANEPVRVAQGLHLGRVPVDVGQGALTDVANPQRQESAGEDITVVGDEDQVTL